MVPMAAPSEQPRRILVISGIRLIAESLASALKERGFLANYQVAGSNERLTRSVLWDPHVALLQADLFGNGAYSRLVEELRIGAVLMVAMSPTVDAPTLERCLKGGASTLLSMDSQLDLFVETMYRVLSNPSLVEEGAREQLAELQERESRAPITRLSPFEFLTPREREVLGEIIRGRSAEVIANESWVAVSTVRSQIKAILQKLGVSSQVAAVAYAREAGWSPPEDTAKSASGVRPPARAVVGPRAEEGEGYERELA